LFDICPQCGMLSASKAVDSTSPFLICPFCSYHIPFLQLPLFIITGASSAGKSSACLNLPGKLPECIILDSDLLWRPEFATPTDNYRSYRSLWLTIALNIHQSGRPIALFGSAVPEQFETLPHRRYFSAIHYLALVCNDVVLTHRIKNRPAWRRSGDETTIQTMLNFNAWLKEHAATTQPAMTLLDTSSSSIEETTAAIAQWIRERLHL
jgi:hypothetical protein